MFGAYLGCELLGLLGAGWIADHLGEALVRPATPCNRWNSALCGALSALFNLTWDVQGLDQCRPGPTLLLVRHASTADTILPVALLSAGLGLKLRYVLKSELLWDPCIDVIGQRVPNVFVRRGDAGEVDRVRALARGLGADETLVLYPEGTRFSPSRQTARLSELHSQPEDIQALARALQVTLAPKPGGVLAILDAEPRLDVVFCAHRP
ncbi:MAG: 1-acyl-sn-glycerol-3-phosphate acyltransferase [Deltaproteobacteria bacterium]|nr:1-acyl-sn-glycerol-3-phosphate acyltransferase [Deltaproteobacteria bacterium]